MCHAYKGKQNGKLLLFPPSLAYRLKKCPPPPTVEQAEILFEDQDYEIGMNSCPLMQEYQSHELKRKKKKYSSCCLTAPCR